VGKILIIEDNSDISLLYTRALFGHEHTMVSSAEDGIKELNSRNFDLIILDMHLPEQSGISVLKHLREELSDKDTAVFVISADDLFRPECESLGIQEWMTKPIEVDVLMKTARQILEERASTKR
jgi:DNA-binding response OmpR family regulator